VFYFVVGKQTLFLSSTSTSTSTSVYPTWSLWNMVFFVKGGWVWMSHADEAWLPVQLKEQRDGGVIIAESELGEIFELNIDSDLPCVQPSSLKPCENMVSLEELNQGAILHNLRMRYNDDEIYTYISSILISVNPFKLLPIYTPAVMDDYRQKLHQRIECPPHVYALADAAFRNLTSDKQPQAVIISGESGAGKTEATKLVLQYLAEMSGQGSAVEQQLLQANPIIEAFGNAKTVRNDNSSRFGKWIQIMFNDMYHIQGAQILNYLLEKSRIVLQGPGERNYHIFYQMCAGASEQERKQFHLRDASEFRYISGGGGDALTVNGMNDAQEYTKMRGAMDVLNFSAQEQHEILTTIAAVMHLGNIDFAKNGDGANSKDTVVADNSKESFETVCSLLQCPSDAMQTALTTKTIKVMTELIKSPIEPEQAALSRDALAKALYGSMFDLIISRTNRALATENMTAMHTVGVLDIFGFESFETNRFEQFCINFANEKLQQHFNHHIFTMEQKAYVQDDINVEHVDFVDNQPCLDLIEMKQTGVLSMCDEEIRIPNGSDMNLLDRMDAQHARNAYYKKRKIGHPVFTVEHYAGQVVYTIEGFLEKNKDKIDDELIAAVRSSKLPLVAELVTASAAESKAASSGPAGRKKVAERTLGSQFKQQLSGLMDTLNSCQPHFIRCIKPNTAKCADNFDSNTVARQLRYLGIQEVVKIRQRGYPVRKEHDMFWRRFKILSVASNSAAAAAAADTSNIRSQCESLLTELKCEAADWRVGNTKVFVRQHLHAWLEREREERLTTLIIRIQALIRGFLWRSRYRRSKAMKQALVAALADTTDYRVLEKATEDYEALEFAVDQDLVIRAKSRAKDLYAQAQAIQGLVVAVESKDETLLTTAIEGAQRVHIAADKPELLAAQQLLESLVSLKEQLRSAIKARQLVPLTIALQTAAALELPENTGLIAEAKSVQARLLEEDKCRRQLAEAVQNRDIEALRTAVSQANSLRVPQEMYQEASDLLDKLIAIQKSLESLRKTVDTKSPDIDDIEAAMKRCSELGVSADHAHMKRGTETIAVLRAAAQAEKEKEEQIANAKSALDAAIEDNDTHSLESAIKKSQLIQSSFGAEASNALRAVTDKAVSQLNTLHRKEEITKKLKVAIQSHKLDELDAALSAAQSEGMTDTHEAKEAATVKNSITSLLETLKKAAADKDAAQLSKFIAKAKDVVNTESKEFAIVERFEKEKDVLVAESEARQALEFAMRGRTGTLLKVAVDKVKTTTGASGAQDTQIKEAEELNQDIRAEEFLRDQELVVAQRRATVAQERRQTRADGRRRTTVVDEKDKVPDSKSSVIDEAMAGTTAFDTMAEYELHLFTNLCSPNEYAKGKLFGKKSLKAGMLYWTKDVIPKPLTKVVVDAQTPEEAKFAKQLHQHAIQVFKGLQGFMGDRSYSFPDSLAAEVLETCLRSYMLRDELFVQIVKQLRRNSKVESTIRGWQMLALAVETFPPSDDLMPFLLHFIQLHAGDNEPNSTVSNYASYCIRALHSTCHSPPKPKAPSIEHITSFKDRAMASGSVLVFFSDNTAIDVPSSPTLTIADLIKDVCKKAGIKTAAGWGIFETKDGVVQYLKPGSIVNDYETARYYVNHPPAAGGKLVSVKSAPTKFLFKKRIYMGGTMAKSLHTDPVGIRIMFHQALEDVTKGLLALAPADAARLQAINAYIVENKMDTHISTTHVDESYAARQKASLRPPTSLFTSEKTTKKRFDKLVAAAAAELKEPTYETYLATVSRFPSYGSQFFTVKQGGAKALPQHLVLAVNMPGVHVVDWKTRDILCFFPIQAIAGWKGSKAKFVIRVQMDSVEFHSESVKKKSPKSGLQTFYFDTNEGVMIADLVRTYVDLLVAHMKNKAKK
jgi:myosin heavy subunit